MDNPTCETCRWWEAFSHPNGLCRRYPPTVLAVGDPADVDVFYPGTPNDYFCGEHQPRRPAEVKAPPPRIDPDTRRVLGRLIETAAAAHAAYGKLPSDHNGDPEYHALQDALKRACAHLAKMDGEGIF